MGGLQSLQEVRGDVARTCRGLEDLDPERGLEQVLHLPGHTKGSIGILTADRALFCGDLMDSMGRPSLEFFIADMTAATASLKKLRSLETDRIYPGHGKPFRLSQVTENR